LGQLSDSNSSRASEFPALVRSRRRLAASAALACCALASASIPAFAAGPDRVRTGTGSSAVAERVVSLVTVAVPEQARRVQHAVEAHQQPSQVRSEESDTSRHQQANWGEHEHAGPGEHEQGAASSHEPAGQGHHEQAGQGRHEQAGQGRREGGGQGHHEQGGRDGQSKDAGSSREAGAGQAMSRTSDRGGRDAHSSSIATLSRKSVEGLTSVVSSDRHSTSVRATVDASVADASRATTPNEHTPTATTAATPTATVSASLPATAPPAASQLAASQPAATQIAATPAPVQTGGVSRHATPGHRSHAARGHGREHKRPVVKSATSHKVLTAAADPAAVGIVASAHTLPRRSEHRAATARRPATHARPSPIVTTITKIVDVVPIPMRVLIGVLCALAIALGLRSSLTALRARRLEAQRGELLEDVGLLQAALLPVSPARLGPVGTSVAYRPAEGPGAGGDFYDVFALDDGRLGVIVGDISGHGRQALPHTALVRFTLRAYLEAGLSPRSAVQTAGAVLERQLGESFATVVAATYHPRERKLVYACAGHPPPIVLGSRSIAPITVCSSPPIATGMRTGTRQTAISVPGRSQVCFHTDGVTDARVAGELYGAERLLRALSELGPEATAPALLERVARETDSRPDDMAACVLSVEGGAEAPVVLAEEVEFSREDLVGDRVMRFLLACGVARGETAEILRSAHAVAQREGTVLLELCVAGGHPSVTVLRNNVEHLHVPSAQRRAGLGGLR
jgi:hypothetical protein